MKIYLFLQYPSSLREKTSDLFIGLLKEIHEIPGLDSLVEQYSRSHKEALKEVNEDCDIAECPEDFIYCPKKKMKIQMEEEKDKVLFTIKFVDYTLSLAPPCSQLSSSTMTPPSSLVSSSTMTPPYSLVSSSSPGSSYSIPSGSDNCRTVSTDVPEVIEEVLDIVSANHDSLKSQDEDLALMLNEEAVQTQTVSAKANPSTTILSKLKIGTLAKDQANLAMSSLDSVCSTGQSKVISDLTTLTGSVKVNSLNTLIPTDQLLRYDQDTTFTVPQEFGGEVTVAGDVRFDAGDVCEEITENPYDITQDDDFFKLLWC